MQQQLSQIITQQLPANCSPAQQAVNESISRIAKILEHYNFNLHRTALASLLVLSVTFLVVQPQISNEVAQNTTIEELAALDEPPQGAAAIISSSYTDLRSSVNAAQTTKVGLGVTASAIPFVTEGNQDQPEKQVSTLVTPDLSNEIPVQADDGSAREVTHTLRPGQTLFHIWRENKAPLSGSTKAGKALEEAGVALKSLKPGQQLILKIENNDIIELKLTLPDGATAVVTGNAQNGYTASLKKIRSTEVERTVTGTILTSFSEAARVGNVPISVADEFVDLFSDRLEFRRELQPGDTFTISFKEIVPAEPGSSLPQALGWGPILRASIRNSGSTLAAIRDIDESSHARYYNENGDPLGSYFLRYPLQFSRISSTYTDARFHPILGRFRAHRGVDFAAPIGTPIRSIGAGVISEIGYHGAAGNMIRISHGPRFTTEYFHLSRFAPGLRAGTRIDRGQLIGTVGMSGLSTGPHLHFGLFDRGEYVDPMRANLPSLSDGQKKLSHIVLARAMDEIKQAYSLSMVAKVITPSKELL